MKFYFVISLLSICMASEYLYIEPISVEERPLKKIEPIVKDECEATTVVVIDNNKTHNSVVVKTSKGESVINNPNYFVSICTKETLPTTPKPMSQEKINLLFADIVAINSPKPLQFVLYFDKKKLADTSKYKVAQVLSVISDRRDSYIKIIGHTDTINSSSVNDKLAKIRADVVYEIIKNSHAEYGYMSVESYGENNLAVKTQDEVLEPLNRRVEIFIQ